MFLATSIIILCHILTWNKKLMKKVVYWLDCFSKGVRVKDIVNFFFCFVVVGFLVVCFKNFSSFKILMIF